MRGLFLLRGGYGLNPFIKGTKVVFLAFRALFESVEVVIKIIMPLFRLTHILMVVVFRVLISIFKSTGSASANLCGSHRSRVYLFVRDVGDPVPITYFGLGVE